jgi:hypothetical protein
MYVTQPADPFTQRKELILKAHQLVLVTVVDVNTRSLIRSGGGFTRDVRQAKPELCHFKASTEGGYHLPASHKLEAPRRKEKKKGCFGAFSTLDYCQGVIIVTGQKTECTGVLTWRFIVTALLVWSCPLRSYHRGLEL